MRMISYAQNCEDVLLRRLFADRTTGFYIDVGANDPVHFSVTKHFYDSGWCGINIEPVQSAYERLCADRVRDCNLNVGLSHRVGRPLFFEANGGGGGLSTFSAAQAEEHRRIGIRFAERSVHVTTLADVCAQYVKQSIDFLTIDVEGHEREVLEGGDWKRWRPRVVVIEATRPMTIIPTHGEWEHRLLAADYLFAFFDGLNRFYVRAEDRHLLPLLSTPANVHDDFVPYEYQHRIEECHRRIEELRKDVETTTRALADASRVLRAQLAMMGDRPDSSEEIVSLALRVASKLSRMSSRFPRTFDVIRWLHRLSFSRRACERAVADQSHSARAVTSWHR